MVERLQKENNILKSENERLRQENSGLRNYINKTFEVVRNLFDFPIDTFKRLVNNFIEHFEKEIM